MESPSPSDTSPALAAADVWGVPFDNGDEIPVFAQSARVAAVAATALYVEVEGRAPTKIGTARLWNAQDIAGFVAGIDGQVERAKYEGGTPPPRVLLDLYQALTRPAAAAHTWTITPTAGARLQQVEPFLWRNLLAWARAPLLLTNTVRMFGWIVLILWPLFGKVLWAYGWWRWGWPMPWQAWVPYSVVGMWWMLAAWGETLDWALAQFTLRGPQPASAYAHTSHSGR